MKIKYLIMVVLLISAASLVYGATYYAVASGSWDDASTWSLTSGGTGGAGVPATDDIVYIGEGTGTYSVNIPAGNHGASLLYLGSAAGNAAGADLVFDGSASLLTVTGTVYVYGSTAASLRTIHVNHGTFTVNSNIHLAYPTAGGTHADSISELVISHGVVTANNLYLYAAPAAPTQSQVVMSGLGTLNLRGNFDLVNGAGILDPGVGGTVVFNGNMLQTVDGGPDVLFHNLNTNNPAGVVFTGLVVIEGTWTQLAGEVTGTLPNVDGYTSIAYNWIQINADDNMMIGFWIDMTTPPLYPQYVNREWELGGDWVGDKTVTFYWSPADDFSFNWDGKTVATWHEGNPHFGISNTDDIPHYIQTELNPDGASGIYNIGLFPEQTLPVEFSAFTAVVTAESYVQLNWTTQSESSLLGYYVYRNTENSVANAQMVSPIITATNTSSTASYSFTDSEVEPGLLYYWVQSMEMNGTSYYYGSINVTLTGENPENPPPVIPTYTGIESIFPNPFNPSTRVSYYIEKAANVSIVIVNLKGQMVRTLVTSHKEPGSYNAIWNGKDDNGTNMASGIYLVRMIAGNQVSSQKIVMLK